MINVTIIKKRQNIIAIEATGHSGYANEGEDIVCSAVSTLLETLIVGLSDVLKVDFEHVIDEEIPHLSIKLSNLTNEEMEKAQILMKTTRLGLKGVADGYAKFIKIKEMQND